MNDQVQTPAEDEVVDQASEVTEATEATAVAADQAGEVEIPDMPYEQLEAVNRAVTEKLRQGREKAKAADINTVKVLVAKHGLKWSDIKPAAAPKNSTGSTVAPKYRDPETGATWSGRGRSPLWLRDKNKEDFLIQTPAAE